MQLWMSLQHMFSIGNLWVYIPAQIINNQADLIDTLLEHTGG